MKNFIRIIICNELKHLIFCSLLPVLFLFQGMFAQDISVDHPWWVNIGAGPAAISGKFSMSAGMDYCYQFDRSYLSGRIIGVTNKNPTIQRIDRSETIYKMSDYGILYGYLWQSGRVYFSAGGGIGLIRMTYESQSGITSNSSVSLPLEAQFFWRPAYFAGIGAYVYTSFNLERQLAGLMVCVQLGSW